MRIAKMALTFVELAELLGIGVTSCLIALSAGSVAPDREPCHGEIVNEGPIVKCDPIHEASLLEKSELSVEGDSTLVRRPNPQLDFLHSRVSLRPVEEVAKQSGTNAAAQVPRMGHDRELKHVRGSAKEAEWLEKGVADQRAVYLGDHVATAAGERLNLRFEGFNRNLTRPCG